MATSTSTSAYNKNLKKSKNLYTLQSHDFFLLLLVLVHQTSNKILHIIIIYLLKFFPSLLVHSALSLSSIMRVCVCTIYHTDTRTVLLSLQQASSYHVCMLCVCCPRPNGRWPPQNTTYQCSYHHLHYLHSYTTHHST
jgi:hypothetical protein